MNYNKKQSNEGTVPSLDWKEISKSTQLNSSSDTVTLERKRRHYKSKYEHRRRKPSHRRNSASKDKYKKHCMHHRKSCEYKQQSSDFRNKLETVTKQTKMQEIHVHKHNFKCIININTINLCDHKNGINEEKSQCSKNQYRPVPRCQKPLCCLTHAKKSHKHRKESCKTGFHQIRDFDRTTNLGESDHMLNKCRHWRHKQRSSIEIASRKGIDNQFDHRTPHSQLNQDVEDKCLKKYLDIPMSYQNALKHSTKYESKLDTLIKRTKERERKLVEQSRNNINATSPYTDISSDEFPTFSEHAASLHSRSTLILDNPLHEIEDSATESFYPIKTELYSPPSFNKYFHSGFEMKIKSELTMDSGAYSPIQHPMQNLFYNQDWIKKDIKREPKETFTMFN